MTKSSFTNKLRINSEVSSPYHPVPCRVIYADSINCHLPRKSFIRDKRWHFQAPSHPGSSGYVNIEVLITKLRLLHLSSRYYVSIYSLYYIT